MTNKTRRHIWPASLVMSIAIIGTLAAFLVLANNPGTLMAQSGGNDSCAGMTEDERAAHILSGGTCGTPNQPPTVDAPAMDPVVIEGLMVEMNGVSVKNTDTVKGLADYFSDPEEDELTFTVGSSNTSAATGMIDEDGNLVITAHDVGEADITVTATDTNGGTATLTIMVSVRLSPAERYGLTPVSVEFDAPAMEQVTLTITAVDADDTPLDEDATVSLLITQFPAESSTSPLVTRVIGLDSSLDNDITDDDILQGLLTVRATDPDGERGFTVYFECTTPGERVEIDMFDEDPQLVAEATISCKEPDEPPPPEADKFRSDMMTVVSYNDWDHHTVVPDGFIIDDSEKNVEHMVTQDPKYNQMGVLVRDEPVVESYQLAISEMENLGLLPGNAPRRTKVQAEEGQHTIEVQVGMSDVQLTVTSMLKGPAYIRFLDSDMQPFGTDVDEEPMWRGADVVGLDSQGRLDLNLTPVLSKAKALAYDQYRVVIPGLATGNAYLDGAAGSYYQGAFRFFNPCPSEDHHFYVEVYESEGKYLKTTEKVLCVLSPRPGPAGLVFEIDSQKPEEGVLRFEPARNSVSHTVLLIDASNRNIVEEVEDAVSPVMFNEEDNVKLNNGWTYHIVVIAAGVNDQYTADAVLDYSVSWLDEADVPQSTDPSDDPTRMNPLCQVDDADITALLADCDADPVNAAPMAVGTIAAVTVTAGEMSDAMDVSGYFSDADMDTLTYTASSDMEMYATAMVNGSMLTITGVAAGMATITVTATDMAGTMATQDIMVTVEVVDMTPMAPTVVMATVDDSDPGSTSVTVTWTDGANVSAYGVVLFSNNFTEWNYIGKGTGGSDTFTNVASGSYIAVVVALDAQGGLMTDAQGNYLYAGATVVTVQ